MTLTTRHIRNVSNTEIFAKILGTPLSIAEEVIKTYDGNLRKMASKNLYKIKEIKGVGEIRKERLEAAFELAKRLEEFRAEENHISDPKSVANLMIPKLRYLEKEALHILCFNTRGKILNIGQQESNTKNDKWGKILSESQISKGNSNSVSFHTREIFKYAIEESANSIILVHNHPSGNPNPTQKDIETTRKIVNAGNQLGIKVADHIIIGNENYFSLKEKGHI